MGHHLLWQEAWDRPRTDESLPARSLAFCGRHKHIRPRVVSLMLSTSVSRFWKAALIDRFTFVNENAAAHGELRIAVSNYRLPADSSKWTEVQGVIPFARKRLFNLSMLGVEAKYVRFSFHVDTS